MEDHSNSTLSSSGINKNRTACWGALHIQEELESTPWEGLIRKIPSALHGSPRLSTLFSQASPSTAHTCCVGPGLNGKPLPLIPFSRVNWRMDCDVLEGRNLALLGPSCPSQDITCSYDRRPRDLSPPRPGRLRGIVTAVANTARGQRRSQAFHPLLWRIQEL